MQLQADLLGIPVEVAAERETTALGAAALAAGRESGVHVGEVYEPSMSADRVAGLRDAWHRALDLTRSS
jgi:glycerol kinase